jgi:hypothetical protein
MRWKRARRKTHWRCDLFFKSFPNNHANLVGLIGWNVDRLGTTSAFGSGHACTTQCKRNHLQPAQCGKCHYDHTGS